MPTNIGQLDGIGWPLLATVVFVLLNGFFVAAEFALVKVRASQIKALAEQGSGRARVASLMLENLNLYLSACQFGITVASLVLGWLAEPAIATLLIAGAAKLGLNVSNGPVVHGIALAIALAIVTVAHMTIGEQAPKVWAIQQAEAVVLRIAYPLRAFTLVFRPLIWMIDSISQLMLRSAGITADAQHEGPMTANELRNVLAAAATAGNITSRQRVFTENILAFATLQVRHILVPRVDIVFLERTAPGEDNLRLVRHTMHSRFPLCMTDLDNTTGIVHAKDVLSAVAANEQVDFSKLARPALFIPDTQPLGRMIFEMQRARVQCAIVLDDHGTALGMAFLEDALEEIVGPIQDEFDQEEARVKEIRPGVKDVAGALPLPEACSILGLSDCGEDDTIGGHVVATLGRMPREGDRVTIGPYNVRVVRVKRNRIERLRFEIDTKDT